ncbi:tRNA pseudouridine(55) synthase TruB [Candidatus Avelusimicrobium caledoniensis]|uniref:tRNA pseudouridine(55) synthase TruB n=1 Tax=Candidatus Avelusimicrobium caledoniensis TaxID=3416220 RepID=UPI003D0FA221
MSSETCPNAPSGLLLIDKPRDFSSHDIIAISRRILRTKKIGHSGTLDPMATGLLILLVGREATKRQAEFLKLSKTYTATLTLGQETDSWDACGNVITEKDVPALTQQDVQNAVQKLSGEIEQPIPFFSAKKINGQKMYSLARAGQEMERKFNRVQVAWTRICLTSAKTVEFTVHCSCGTYVRSLGYLLANELGTVGHLTQLRRLEIGPYNVQNAFDGTQLKQTDTDTLYKRIISL